MPAVRGVSQETVREIVQRHHLDPKLADLDGATLIEYLAARVEHQEALLCAAIPGVLERIDRREPRR